MLLLMGITDSDERDRQVCGFLPLDRLVQADILQNEMDQNRDGKITMKEFADAARRKYECRSLLDTVKDLAFSMALQRMSRCRGRSNRTKQVCAGAWDNNLQPRMNSSPQRRRFSRNRKMLTVGVRRCFR